MECVVNRNITNSINTRASHSRSHYIDRMRNVHSITWILNSSSNLTHLSPHDSVAINPIILVPASIRVIILKFNVSIVSKEAVASANVPTCALCGVAGVR